MEWLSGWENVGGSVGGFALSVIIFIKFGLPKILDYLESNEKRHENRIDNLIKNSREEREQFYTNLKEISVKFENVDHRLETIENKIDHIAHG
jgi:chaperonin cofactor prefoldin